MKIKQKYDNSAYLMILPAYLIFSVFVLLPVFIVAYYSITNFNMYTKPELTGLSNYIALFKDKDFLIAVKNTLVYSVLTLFPQLAIGLFIAILLYRIKAITIFQNIILYTQYNVHGMYIDDLALDIRSDFWITKHAF